MLAPRGRYPTRRPASVPLTGSARSATHNASTKPLAYGSCRAVSLPEVEYDAGGEIRRVHGNGRTRLRGRELRAHKTLVGQPVALPSQSKDEKPVTYILKHLQRLPSVCTSPRRADCYLMGKVFLLLFVHKKKTPASLAKAGACLGGCPAYRRRRWL